MGSNWGAVERYRAVAERYRRRAEQSANPALRQAYADLAAGYVGLADNQELIERAHAAIGRYDVASDAHALEPATTHRQPPESATRH